MNMEKEPGFGTPEKESQEKMEDMKRYLGLEVQHYLKDEVQDIKQAGNFTFDLGENIKAEIDVYEVKLTSGKTVFAAEGGWNQRLKNIYGQELPNAETAAKIHVYTLIKMLELNNPDAKGLADDVADDIDLPEEYRKTH